VQPKLLLLILLILHAIAANAQRLKPVDSSLYNFSKSAVKKLDNRFGVTQGARSLKNQVLEPLKKIYTNPIQFNNSGVDQHGMVDTSYINEGSSSFLGGMVFSTNWTVLDIPLQLNYEYLRWSDFSKPVSNFNFQYDRDNYLAGLKKNLSAKGALNKLLPNLQNPFEDIKKSAESLLRNELNNISARYKNLLTEELEALGPVGGLLNQDMKSIREKYLNANFIKTVVEKESRLASLQNSLNIGQSIDRKEYDSLNSSLQVFKGVQEIVQAVEKHKKNWDSSGLVTRLKEWDLMNKEKLLQLTKDPSTIITAARKNLNLKGIQRFFLKVNKLNLGQNTASLTPLSVQHFLNKGIATEFLNKNKYLSLLSGNNFRSIPLTDLPFVNTLFPSVSAKSISFGKGKPSQNFSRISVSSYEQSPNSFNAFSALNSFRRSIVTSFSKEFSVGSKGLVTTEVSRSVSNYRSSNGGYSADNKVVDGLLSTDDLMKNTALSVKYQDEFSKAGLSYQVHFKKAANGYDNPGNSFTNQGSKEAGFGIRKNFMKKKLQISIRNDIKEYQYNDQSDGKWRSMCSVVDMRLKLKQGQSVSLRYLPSRMLRIEGSEKNTLTYFDRLSVDANLTKSLQHFHYNNYISLAYQKNKYVLNNDYIGNKALLFSSNQTLMFNKRLLYWNTQLSQSENNAQFVYFNSMLNSEIGTSYNLFNKIQGTTMLVYGSVKNWYQQAGIRQTVSMAINENFGADMYIDVRRNIKLYQPLLFGLTRGEINFHYSFNK
jgi:hypothetical protein